MHVSFMSPFYFFLLELANQRDEVMSRKKKSLRYTSEKNDTFLFLFKLCKNQRSSTSCLVGIPSFLGKDIGI